MAASEAPLVHLKVQVSGILSITVQELWEVLRDYANAQTWFGTYRGVKTFTTLLPGSINCQIGAMRYVSFGHLGFVDQLEALDDERYIMKYKLISHPENTNPFPGSFLNYQSIIHLEEVTRGAISYMKWTGEFDTDPQVCESMRQAITEVFEAGFQALEAMISSLRPGLPGQSPANIGSFGAQRGVQGVRGQNVGDLQHGMANLHLKHSTSMPVHLYNPMPAQEYPNSSRPMRPGPQHGYMADLPEHTQAASVDMNYQAASPRHADPSGFPARRPGSGGQLSQNPNQWTSGGSASTINISTLPSQRSAEELESNSRRQPRPRVAERIPEGSPYMDTTTSFHPDMEGDPAGPKDKRRQVNVDMHHRDHSLGSASSEPQTESPFQPSPPRSVDPLMQEREEFKAALLATHKLAKTPSESSLYSGQPGTHSPSEPDWSQVMQHKDEDIRVASLSNPGVSSPLHSHPSEPARSHADWSRLGRHREGEPQEGSRRGVAGMRSPSTANPSPVFQNAGGPFAAASHRNSSNSMGSGQVQGRGIERSPSHQSLNTISPNTSSALGHSAGSVFDER